MAKSKPAPADEAGPLAVVVRKREPQSQFEANLPSFPALVPGQSLAEWYVGERARIDAVRKNAKERIKLAQAAMMLELDRQQADLERRYHKHAMDEVASTLALVPAEKRSKTVRYVTGDAKFRDVPPALKIVDEQKAIEWATMNLPDAVKEKTTYSLVHAELEKHAIETGELPDGCDMTEQTEQFYPKAEFADQFGRLSEETAKLLFNEEATNDVPA